MTSRYPKNTATAWILRDHKLGSAQQCLALAQNLGCNYAVKWLDLHSLYRLLPPHFTPMSLNILREKSRLSLSPPYPDLIITSGARMIKPALALGKAAPKTKLIYIHKPCVDAKAFDAIIAPQYDGCKEAINIKLGLSLPLTFVESSQDLPKELTALLLGGPNKHYNFPNSEQLITDIKAFLEQNRGSVYCCGSRRTPASLLSALATAFENEARFFLWHFGMKTPNPYPLLLRKAVCFIISADSTSMLAEANATGKPCYVLNLPKKRKLESKFDKMQNQLIGEGYFGSFNGGISAYPLKKIDDNQKATQAILDRFPELFKE